MSTHPTVIVDERMFAHEAMEIKGVGRGLLIEIVGFSHLQASSYRFRRASGDGASRLAREYAGKRTRYGSGSP
jgi:hypothetical protein